jgi:SulP family sulfate permease
LEQRKSKSNGELEYILTLAQQVSFFNKANVAKALENIPANSKLIIDCSKSVKIAVEVMELITEFEVEAKRKNINLEKLNFIKKAA